MEFTFKKATRKNSKARIALAGISGSGKTYTALKFAQVLSPGSIALIDTEHGSASKYDYLADFDVLQLPREATVDAFIKAIDAAASAGYGALIVDSYSHAWDAMLDEVEKIATARTSGNTFRAWGLAKPIEQRLLNTLLHYPGHVIVTMRSKADYVVDDNAKGKKAPKKVGLAPVQRAGVEYEFDVFGTLDEFNNLSITKTRVPAFKPGDVIRQPGEDTARVYLEWLTSGARSLPAEVARVASADGLLGFAKENAGEIRSLQASEKADFNAAIKAACHRLDVDYQEVVKELRGK